MFCRKAAAFALAFFLTCFSPGQFLAAMPMTPVAPVLEETGQSEPELPPPPPKTPDDPPVGPSGEPPAEDAPAESEEPATGIASFEDLWSWLEEHRESGGSAYLLNDVTVPKDGVYKISAYTDDGLCYLDAGAFTIYIQGRLELLSWLEISGEGGENGVLHVEQDGFLQITIPDSGSDCGELSILPVTARSGYAVYQDEGAFLQVDTDAVDLDSIHLADRPVVWPAYDSAYYEGLIDHIPVVVLPREGGDIAALLPQTSPGYFCQDADFEYTMQELPVTWNVKQHAADFEAGRRFMLTGRYDADVDVYRAQPACLVVFRQEQAPVFLQGLAAPGTGKNLYFHFMLHQSDPDAAYRLEYSMDNETWQSAEDYLYLEDQWDSYLEYRGIVGKTEEPPRFFSVSATDSQGNTLYSDTIEVTWDDTIAGLDNGGGRNGETAPGDPGDAQLPPDTISPPQTEDPEDTQPTADPEPAEDPENGKSPEHSVPPVETAHPPEQDRVIYDAGHWPVAEIIPWLPPTDMGQLPPIPTPSQQQQPQEQNDPPAPEVPPAAAGETPTERLPESEPLPENTAPPVQLAELPAQAQVDQPAPSAPASSPSADAPPRSPLSPGAQIAAACAVIALIGAPVYLTPRLKKWFSRRQG